MLRDYVISRPSHSIYTVHQHVYALVGEAPRPLFLPMKDVVVVRTVADLSAQAIAVRDIPTVVDGIEVKVLLRASVETKAKGRRTYAKGNEKVFRSEWLDRRAVAAGLRLTSEPEIHGSREYIDKLPFGWWMDATVFTFTAEVTDAELFHQGVANGVGRTGKAFGFSMMVFNLVGED